MDRSRGSRPLEETEHDLVMRARQGDTAAFELLVRRYQDLAFRVAYMITGSPDDAEDVAQDAFVRAYAALDRFRLDDPFRPWLLTIVANVARSRRAAGARHPTQSLSANTNHLASPDRDSPEVLALDAERQVILGRYFLDLSEAEMADALGCARGTVKSRLSRALRRLRQQVTPAAPGTGGRDG